MGQIPLAFQGHMLYTGPMRSGQIICNTRLTQAMLSYSKERREFFMMASDYGPGLRFSQIYADAVDVGVIVVGKTGKEVVYFLDHTERDLENDVKWWRFRPTNESVRNVPSARGTSVVIFND